MIKNSESILLRIKQDVEGWTSYFTFDCCCFVFATRQLTQNEKRTCLYRATEYTGFSTFEKTLVCTFISLPFSNLLYSSFRLPPKCMRSFFIFLSIYLCFSSAAVNRATESTKRIFGKFPIRKNCASKNCADFEPESFLSFRTFSFKSKYFLHKTKMSCHIWKSLIFNDLFGVDCRTISKPRRPLPINLLGNIPPTSSC